MPILFIKTLLLSSVAAPEAQLLPLRTDGSIPVWLVAGPFPNAAPLSHGPGCFGFYTDYLDQAGGEAAANPADGESAGTSAWRVAFSDPIGTLDYIEYFRADKSTPGVAYAFCTLVAQEAREALLLVRSNDGVRVWLNGEGVHELHKGRGVDEGEADRVPVTLRQGENRLLLKVDQSAGAWGQRVHVCDSAGAPVEGVQVQVALTRPLRGHFHGAHFASTPLVRKTKEGPRQVLVGSVVSGGLKQVRCTVRGGATNEHVELGDLAEGVHRLELPIPVLEASATATITLEAASDQLSLQEVPLSPPKPWTVYLVQHSHTDIGYTRPQHELLPDFLRFIDYALDYCDQTDNYPDDAKFRWTCESAWVVREFLKRRPPEQVERFVRRVREGRIEITALYLNLDELADENLMDASLNPLREFLAMGLPVVSATQNDVPGAAWCLADYLPELGVKYLTMGINNDRTPRPFNVPTAFWWESPSGNRLLAWRPDHYHTANQLRIHQGDLELFQRNTLEYLRSIEQRGYPMDRVAMQYSGLQIDNSPPSTVACDLIRMWNETYEWPKLRAATAGEFPAWVEAQHAAELPVYRGAWPNWWTDGYAFAHVETAQARRAHVALGVAESLLSIAQLRGLALPESVPENIARVENSLLFYDEHTFGAQEEFTNPMAENSMVQWGEKVAHVWNALQDVEMLKESAWGTLQTQVLRDTVPTVAVFNTLAWERSGLVELYIGHEILPLAASCRFIDTVSGQALPAHRMRSRFEGSYWNLWVDDVPAMGQRSLRIEISAEAVAELPSSPPQPTHIIEDDFYRIEVDPETAAIRSLIDKTLDRELVRDGAAWGLGQIMRDTLTDAHFHNRASFLERSTRSTVTKVRLLGVTDTPLWRSLALAADLEGCAPSAETPGLRVEYRIYKHKKQIEIVYTIRKAFVSTPESLYVAFPFAYPEGQFIYEAQGGLVRPGIDQIPGSSSDWHTVQNFLVIRDASSQIVLSCDAIPLVQFGDINMGKWQQVAKIDQPDVYSWVMNNYWTATFPGSKESEFTWSYQFTSTSDTGNTTATRFGWESRTPLAAWALPATGAKRGETSFSTITALPAEVLVVNIRPGINERIKWMLRDLDQTRRTWTVETNNTPVKIP